MDIWHLCDIHGGGLPSPVVTQKGSNLALIKADAKAIHSRSEATAEYLEQVLDTDTLHQVDWLCFKEWLTYIQKKTTTYIVYYLFVWTRDENLKR